MTTRLATPADIPAMHRIRMAVRENRLVSTVIGEADYVEMLQSHGRGWVGELDGAIRGFAVGDRRDGNIWALFVQPEYEGRGLGRALHDRMVDWLFEQGHSTLWLSTDPATRARGFYERAGWRVAEPLPSGEIRMRLDVHARFRLDEPPGV